MTCYLTSVRADTLAMRVDQFGAAPKSPIRRPLRAARVSRAVVWVTHASVGITDSMAIRGDYLIQPFPRFVPGYDFIGVIEHLPKAAQCHLSVGQRVAGVLPRMGAHSNRIAVSPSLLVPVPDGLDSAVAATVPLDAVTAWFALDALGHDRESVLVQGAGGAVGSWAVQMATARGCAVYGTASPRSRDHAQALGAEVFDYRDPAWIDALRTVTEGGVAGVIDHTGSRAIRRVVAPGGRIVRTAFGEKPGRQRRATATGFLTATLRRHANPTEKVCSIPMLLATHRVAYRHALAEALDDLAAGGLTAPEPRLLPFDQYRAAVAEAEHASPGAKVILALE